MTPTPTPTPTLSLPDLPRSSSKTWYGSLQSFFSVIPASASEPTTSTASTATSATALSWFSFLSSTTLTQRNNFHFNSRDVYVNSLYLSNIQSNIIKSSMYMTYYTPSRSFTCFHLPTQERLFFISSSSLVNQIIAYETMPNNPKTKRIQSYQYNQALLSGNPVSNASLNEENYIKHQHKLFVKLAQELKIDDQILPSTREVIHDCNVVKFVISLTAQVYLPMLLNIPPESVKHILPDFMTLLEILESATGKHNITFQNYLDHEKVVYSDLMEQQYIRLFYRIIMKAIHGSHSDIDASILESNGSLEEVSEAIITSLSSSNIVMVLSTVMDPILDARRMVNNILSWIDNMLNVVHTVVNLIVLIGRNNDGVYTKEFYASSLPCGRALATMFMRHVMEPFQVKKENGYSLQFRPGDIIMMSNGNLDTTFGGKGRKCPSKPWSHLFMSQILELITNHYDIQFTSPACPSSSSCLPSRNSSNRLSVPPQDKENNSWFWNKFSTQGIELRPHESN